MNTQSKQQWNGSGLSSSKSLGVNVVIGMWSFKH